MKACAASPAPSWPSLGASGAAVGIDRAAAANWSAICCGWHRGGIAEKTGAYWLIAIAGYVLQMAAVPALALAGSWQAAALFIVLERSGKAMRNPAANLMLEPRRTQIGQGWAFGLHEAMDQTGACGGPLIAAFVLAHHGDYRTAFLWLGIPRGFHRADGASRSACAMALPGNSTRTQDARRAPAPRLLDLCRGLRAGRFRLCRLSADRLSFRQAMRCLPHLDSDFLCPGMGASGAGSLLFGRWFDRAGLIVLVPGFVIGALVAPLAFYGGFALALAGVLLWGISQGVHDAVMNAAIAKFVPESLRARAFGSFSAIYGIAWFRRQRLAGLALRPHPAGAGGRVGYRAAAGAYSTEDGDAQGLTP